MTRPIIFMYMANRDNINSFCDNLNQNKILYNKLITGGNNPTITNSFNFKNLAENGKYKIMNKTNIFDYNIPDAPNDLSAVIVDVYNTVFIRFTAPKKRITYTIQLYDNSGNLIKEFKTEKTVYKIDCNIIFNNLVQLPDLINNGYSFIITANINNGVYLGESLTVSDYIITDDKESFLINLENTVIDFTNVDPNNNNNNTLFQDISYYTITIFDTNGNIINKTNTVYTNYIFSELVYNNSYFIYVTATNNNGTSGNSSIKITIN